MTGLDCVCFLFASASGFILFCLKLCKDFFGLLDFVCFCVCVGGRGRSKGGLINVLKRQSIDKVSCSFFLACAYLESCKPRGRK